MNNYKHFKAEAIDYKGQLRKIPKSKNKLQPLFEALTNAIEAIKLSDNKDKGEIEIRLSFKNGNLFSAKELVKIVFIDNGIGFNDENFDRFKKIYDTSKNFYNHGSGRIQYIHFFDVIEIESIYKDEKSSTGFYKRFLKLSKNQSFLEQNSIMSYTEAEEIKTDNIQTEINFKNLLDDNDKNYYSSLSITQFKEKLINHYLAYFVENRANLPKISITKFEDNKRLKSEYIDIQDIEQVDKTEPIEINYKKFSDDGKTIIKSDIKAKFDIKAFKINKDILKDNSLKLTSKGEIVEGDIAKNFELEILKSDDIIDNKRYLFLVSSDYITNRHDDTRENLKIYSEEEFKTNSSLFIEDEVILLDDIQNEVNSHILSMYDEILERQEEQKINLEKLKDMFLLDENSMKKIKITLQDTDESILKKVYKEDANLIAQKDANIKEQIDNIHELDPTAKDYNQELNDRVQFLTKKIPLQNKTALTHYVARRKLVLELFQKILDKELLIQKNSKRNMDEKLLHNLIFQQSFDNPDKSDLWLISEDFIYFKGTSEKRLSDIEISGKKILKEDYELTNEEKDYIKSLDENRYSKKPDILLFPNEGKCIIIEFKNPNVNASKYLPQIDDYAGLIWNFAKEEFQFNTFYGYLIGENIEPKEVRMKEPRFQESYHFDYLFRPSQPVAGIYRSGDANLYTEVIKYSTLLERAKKRNEIFIEKLLGKSK